jgi:type VI secretion system protein VasG
MLSVEIKPLLKRLNPFCTRALEGAAGLCVSRSHYEVTVEHLVSRLLDETGADWYLILKQFGVNSTAVRKNLDRTLEEMRTGNAGKPAFSPLLLQWIQDSWLIASVNLGESCIRSGSLLLALLLKPAIYAGGSYTDLLESISREGLEGQFFKILANSIETAESSTSGAAAGEGGEAGPMAAGGALAKYCEDFTQKARDGRIDAVFGRDNEIRQIIDILGRRRKNNPIAVGEAGVGKTAVIEGLALKIVQGDVPDSLKDVAILGLDMALLQAGAGVKGEFENRLKTVISEVKASPKPIILFIDEAHTLIGAGGSAGSGDAANLLKPALARGELKTLAATTFSEYKKYIEKDPALARRFQPVKLDEPTVETSILILRGCKAAYEKAHNVMVRDDAIRAAAELSSRYITGRYLPDKAIDLIDTCCARVKISMASKPPQLEDRVHSMQALEREKSALLRDQEHGVTVDTERLIDIDALLEKLGAEVEQISARWQQEKAAVDRVVGIRNHLADLRKKAAPAEGETPVSSEELEQELATVTAELEAIQGNAAMVKYEVDPDVVALVISDWTGIPLGKVLRDQAQSVLHMEDDLLARIKGQDHAMHIVTEVIKSTKSGIADPNQPMGVFLFVGPSGVGKTETALTVADMMFGGEQYTVTVNMSEFQEKHTVSRLIGSPPGYVGYGEGGMLTEAVRNRPYCVVLLDEVEKAHPDVLNLFYQVFDKGEMGDGEGRVINFRNTILFLTSNLATDVITEMTKEGEKPEMEVLTSAIRPILSNWFKPALLARMNIVPFYALDPAAMSGIVRLKLDKLGRQLLHSNKMKFSYSDAVVDTIAARCTEVETGARNIDYIVRGTIMPQLSQEILNHMADGAMPASVTLDLGSEGNFSFSFS